MQTRLTLWGMNDNKMWIPYLSTEAEYERLFQYLLFTRSRWPFPSACHGTLGHLPQLMIEKQKQRFRSSSRMIIAYSPLERTPFIYRIRKDIAKWEIWPCVLESFHLRYCIDPRISSGSDAGHTGRMQVMRRREDQRGLIEWIFCSWACQSARLIGREQGQGFVRLRSRPRSWYSI